MVFRGRLEIGVVVKFMVRVKMIDFSSMVNQNGMCKPALTPTPTVEVFFLIFIFPPIQNGTSLK